jgi:UDP-GlcNAc:undecaprenyl-phosphate GlcNAc-1-phosphate transferase
MVSAATYALIGLGLSLLLTPLSRVAALRLGYVAGPTEDRWHQRPIALSGGVAVFLAVVVPFAVLQSVREIWVLVVSGALIFTVGLVDDVISLKPAGKLVAQIVVASLLVFFGFRLQWVESLTVDVLLTLVWIVGITNALNLIDNMDGLCAGVGLIAIVALLLGVGPQTGVTPTVLYLALLAGAMAGFLVYNVHPASVFLGDSGSLFIGLTLAAASLEFSQYAVGSNLLSTIAAPVLVLLIPIFDTTLVTMSRLWAGRPASQGGLDHSSHRLVAIGLPERTAVAVLWILASLGAAFGWSLGRGTGWSGLSAALFVLAMILLAVYLAQVRVYKDQDGQVPVGKVTPFVVEFMYKRRIAEVILDVCLVALAYYAAYALRFEGSQYQLNLRYFLESLPIVVAVQIAALYAVGAYRLAWKHFGLMDVVVLGKAVLLAIFVVIGVIVYMNRFENYSRAVFVIYDAFLILLLTASRASFRLFGEFVQRRRQGRRLIIYGSGEHRSMVVRALLDGPTVYQMLGFVDDDHVNRGTRVQGYPVLGGHEQLVSLIQAGGVDNLVITGQVFDVDRLRELEGLCAHHGVGFSRFRYGLEEVVAVS